MQVPFSFCIPGCYGKKKGIKFLLRLFQGRYESWEDLCVSLRGSTVPHELLRVRFEGGFGPDKELS